MLDDDDHADVLLHDRVTIGTFQCNHSPCPHEGRDSVCQVALVRRPQQLIKAGLAERVGVENRVVPLRAAHAYDLLRQVQ
eukprot:CAMPEP_0119084756 /NCGR_PEP_ID=MMETSP1178-20130426/130962_1 /TAXON_ID=33656 /ORGANISM="unid sp, Strain CCMP2000" /LENGTH=79 /DNA_ID=CAMNT_0007067745 /DNA_START=76 /DNA_END=315 /DNA_ORIENTATION=+